jgi:EAL domain-containing protein (putative c-di-GMP-specific phosphodiesterase class I)
MRIIAEKRIEPVYQPIIDVAKNSTIGYEALARNCAMDVEKMFQSAAYYGLTRDLDILCMHAAIENSPSCKKLFINILPFTLIWLTISDKLTRILDKSEYPIVFEIIENEKIPYNITDLLLAIDIIRSYGFKIAIDDISQGFSRIQAISMLNPDYIKMDRELAINNTNHYNTIKKSIITLSKDIGSEIIAEGIETEIEYNNLLALGVNLYQGYYFGRPMLPKKGDELIDNIR